MKKFKPTKKSSTRVSVALDLVVLRLAKRWERNARRIQKAAHDSDNLCLQIKADTQLADVWELRAEIRKTQNARTELRKDAR